MTLESHPVNEHGLNSIQSAAIDRAQRRAAQAGGTFPEPDSGYVDTTGTLHLFWSRNGAKLWLNLSRVGDIETSISTEGRQDVATVGECVKFQIVMQSLFAVDAPIESSSRLLKP